MRAVRVCARSFRAAEALLAGVKNKEAHVLKPCFQPCVGPRGLRPGSLVGGTSRPIMRYCRMWYGIKTGMENSSMAAKGGNLQAMCGWEIRGGEGGGQDGWVDWEAGL